MAEKKIKKKSPPKKKPIAAKPAKRTKSEPAKRQKIAESTRISPDVDVVAAESILQISPAERILVVGEEPLVSEYLELFASRRIDVATSLDVFPASIPVVLELTNVDLSIKRETLKRLDSALPPSTIILSSSVTVSATEQVTWIEHRHRLVGFGALPSLSSRPLVEIAPTIFSPASVIEQALEFFGRLDKKGEIVQDRVGLVFPRIICRLINEAAFALSEEIAVPQDLDAAIKLGLNHPRGPIEWVDRLGLTQVAAVLHALERESGDPRYRIAPLLRQMALAGEWWKR